ncbi:MAG TPA: YIP1 family protein [Gemmatimonadales bacterium]|nr:YIP1 family protein [Gemmatimonadales bacterium]
MITSLWFRIWFRPRAAIREAVNIGALRSAALFAMASGVVQSFVAAANHHVGAGTSALLIILIAFAVGAVWGLFQLGLLTTLLHIVGRWTNSPGSFWDLCTAVGWASVPVTAALPLWLLATAILGRLVFVDPQDVAWTNLAHMLLVALVALGTAVCLAWWWVVLAKAVAEVRQISTWAAFGHLGLGLAVLGLAGLFLALAGLLVMRVMHGSHPTESTVLRM